MGDSERVYDLATVRTIGRVCLAVGLFCGAGFVGCAWWLVTVL